MPRSVPPSVSRLRPTTPFRSARSSYAPRAALFELPREGASGRRERRAWVGRMEQQRVDGDAVQRGDAPAHVLRDAARTPIGDPRAAITPHPAPCSVESLMHPRAIRMVALRSVGGATLRRHVRRSCSSVRACAHATGGCPTLASSRRRSTRLPGQRARRCGRAALALQRALRRACARRGRRCTPRRALLLRGATLGEVTLRFLPGAPRGRGLLWRFQLHTGTPSLREADRDRLLRASRPVFSLANVLDLLAHEPAGLGARGLPLSLVALRALDDLLLGHGNHLSENREKQRPDQRARRSLRGRSVDPARRRGSAGSRSTPSPVARCAR